jgi:uncharacterized iron-regulated membrane protein
MKIFFRNIHLYLSLAAGLIIMMSCLTGAILVFEHEIDHAFNESRYTVEAKGKRLPLSALIKNALESTPKAKLASVKVYSEANRTVEIGLLTPEKKEEGKGNKSEGEHKEHEGKKGAEKHEGESKGPDGKKMPKGGGKPSLIAYVDPYTGKVVDVFNRKKSFFFTVEMLHRFLLSGNDGIGKKIVGFSTFFFFFILITGIVLWWPKTKAILRQRLKIKANSGWKRFNHDMHIVTGFYMSIFLVIIVLTGLTMSFNWISKGIFTLTGTKMENPEPPESIYQEGVKSVSIDAVYKQLSETEKDAEFINIRMPKDSAGVVSASILPHNALETAFNTYYIDQFSGKLIGENKAADKNLGQKIRSYVKPVHTGDVFGLPTKILSFVISLLAFTFPITGVIMWLNRLKGERNKKQKDRAKREAVVA